MGNEAMAVLVIVAALVAAVIVLLLFDWAAERRQDRIRERAKLDAPIPAEAYEAAAQRLVIHLDQLQTRLLAERQTRAQERTDHELEVARFQEVVARLEWMLSLSSYDPISGYLDQMGPMEEQELYERLGEGSSPAAFHGRLLAGLTAGLYRCARWGDDPDGRKMWWLDGQRPQAVVAFDAEAKRATADSVVEAERTVEALLALPPVRRR